MWCMLSHGFLFQHQHTLSGSWHIGLAFPGGRHAPENVRPTGVPSGFSRVSSGHKDVSSIVQTHETVPIISNWQRGEGLERAAIGSLVCAFDVLYAPRHNEAVCRVVRSCTKVSWRTHTGGKCWLSYSLCHLWYFESFDLTFQILPKNLSLHCSGNNLPKAIGRFCHHIRGALHLKRLVWL